ncbi:MAG: PIN domain-containing protein, partial [Thermoplasmata archaeon]
MKLFIDTNVFVSILNKERNYQASKDILDSIHKGKHTGITSAICIAEVLSGFYSKGEKEKGDRFLADVKLIENLSIIDVDIGIAKEAAQIRAKYKLKLPDAIIIATCMAHGCSLVTKDEALTKI